MVQPFGRRLLFLWGLNPKTCGDYPSGEATMYSDIIVQGWALSHAGVKQVDIYADDNVPFLGLQHADYQEVTCLRALPTQENTRMHKTAAIPTQLMQAGLLGNTVRVAAVSFDGTTQSMSRTISVGPKARMCLDFLSDNATVNESVAIYGWAVSHAGIDRVDIYVDDVSLIGSVEQLNERSDVNSSVNTAGQYKDALNSGFSYTIAAGQLSVGKHYLCFSGKQ